MRDNMFTKSRSNSHRVPAAAYHSTTYACVKTSASQFYVLNKVSIDSSVETTCGRSLKVLGL